MSRGEGKKPKPGDMVKMIVAGITLDPTNNMPIIILKDENDEMAIPIWIGLIEASAIATELEGIKLARPMTHDLLKSILTKLGGKLLRIEVNDLRDNTFYAWIYMIVQGKESRIDARPSDALAIALRMKAPIYVNEKVFEKSKKVESLGKAEIQDDEAKKWTDILENLSPEDFGKYKM